MSRMCDLESKVEPPAPRPPRPLAAAPPPRPPTARPVLGRMPLSTRKTRYPAAIVADARSFKSIAAASGRRDDPLRQARRRIELDVLTRLATEQLIERHVQSLALDIPKRQVDG